MQDLSNMIINRVVSSLHFTSERSSAAIHRADRGRWAVALKATGKTVYTCGNKNVLCDALHPVILPMGCTYDWLSLEAGNCCMLEFECDESYNEIFGFSINDNAFLLKKLADIERRLITQKPLHQMKNLNDCYDILIYLLGKKYENYMPSNRYDIIRPAAEYIRKNFGESGITNEFLAELCGISTVYFRKVFTKYYGVPPAQYLNMQRMEKAQEFLQSDYSSISQIAESVGYNSIYHFSKMFKKYVGISPSEYVKSGIVKIK